MDHLQNDSSLALRYGCLDLLFFVNPCLETIIHYFGFNSSNAEMSP